MRRLLLALCLLPATACLGNSPSSPTPIDREIVLAQGQTAQVGGDVSVGFVSVLGDSRCPINAGCIQGGDAIVRITVTSTRGRGDRDLHTGTLAPVTFEDLELRLVDLHPYPFGGRTTDPADYRATLHVKR
jgi:hypothetical protein